MPGTQAQERRRIERVRTLAQQTLLGSRMSLVATAVLGPLMVPGVGWAAYAAWAVAMVAGFLGRNVLVRGVLGRDEFSPREERWIELSTVALAFVINLPSPLFMPAKSMVERSLYSTVQITWAAVAVLILGLQPRGYRLYVAVGFTLMAIGWARVLPPALGATSAVMLAAAAFALTRFSARLTEVFDESVEMRHQNAELVAKLHESIAETARAQQARSRFLAAASHDLLQPVHALVLLVGVLRDGATRSTREQAAGRIELTARAIESMFRGLLDQARLDAGAVLPRIEPVALATVCRAIEAAYAPRCQERGLAFVLGCNERLRVAADPALLDRVLRNLVDNAVKFTERGEVALRARRAEAEVSVSVSDTGPGIAAADQPRVFEAFFRGSAAARAGVEGVGLGLAVTSQLLELMGGRIAMESVPGSGTRVTVTPQAAQALAPAPASSGGHAPLAYRRLLVVEDDRSAREAMVLWLEHQGCEVLAAASLGEALAAAEDGSFEPDCLLSDYHLGAGPDGLATLAALRARYGPLPALLVTGDAVDVGALPQDVTLLRKPVQPEQLLKLLQSPARDAA